MKPETVEETNFCVQAKPVRVLILEHSHQDIELLLFELRKSGLSVEHTIAKDHEQFSRAIENWTFDAVLADYRLPGWTGLDALKELRANGKDIPFLLVTGTLGEEAAVECIKQGVSDYILKDRLSRLPVALKRVLQERALQEEKIRAVAALARSESRLRSIVEAEPHCVKIVDAQGVLREMNPAGLRMLGADRAEEVIGKSFYPLLLPEYHAGFAALLEQTCSGGSGALEFEIRNLKGARRWLETHLVPFRSGEGEILEVLAVTLDITDRKNAEESLRQSEARNRELVENSVYGIFHATSSGEFLDANPALQAMLGGSSFEELRAMNLSRDVFRFPEQFAQFMGECRTRGKLRNAEAEWRRRDGGHAMVRLHLRRLTPFDHADVVEWIAEDVTELRALERQLRQAQKFEAIGQLAGGVAHDFNNVVGAILGWAELGFEQSRSNPEVAERFARIREQADRAAALTRELLAFARRQVLQPRPVDLNTVAGSLASFLDKVIGKDIELKVVTAPLDVVKADPTQIEQVLMNLCLNARDAMPTGGRLLIETEMVELDDSYCRFYPYVTSGRYAVLSVSDTGTGMDSETRERIFEPFFTTKGHGKGTGMGLATVYGIIKQHGGFIHVYSEPGQGSLFRVYLPTAEGMEGEGTPEKIATPSRGESRGSETILIAEDHESIREMARQTLLSLGYRVLSASDGQQALQLCEDEAPAMAILDVIMPKLGGPATAAKLAELFGEFPVLFTSGYSQDANQLAETTDDKHYLQKPYSPTTLGRMVREILDQAKAKSSEASCTEQRAGKEGARKAGAEGR